MGTQSIRVRKNADVDRGLMLRPYVHEMCKSIVKVADTRALEANRGSDPNVSFGSLEILDRRIYELSDGFAAAHCDPRGNSVLHLARYRANGLER
jgi:hypothetical protein